MDPPVTYLEIIRAALIPALLYYLSLILIVHFHARRMSIATEGAPVDTAPAAAETGEAAKRSIAAGIVFGSALGSLILFLLLGYTAFRAVTLSLVAIVVVSSFFNKGATRLDWRFTLLSLVTEAELLMLTASGDPAGWLEVLLPVAIATLGVTCFAAGIAGQLRQPVSACAWRSFRRLSRVAAGTAGVVHVLYAPRGQPRRDWPPDYCSTTRGMSPRNRFGSLEVPVERILQRATGRKQCPPTTSLAAGRRRRPCWMAATFA